MQAREYPLDVALGLPHLCLSLYSLSLSLAVSGSDGDRDRLVKLVVSFSYAVSKAPRRWTRYYYPTFPLTMYVHTRRDGAYAQQNGASEWMNMTEDVPCP